MKFKTLAMRIWVTFTSIILVIVCAIMFMYLVVYRTIDESAKSKDLMIVHETILDGTFSSFTRFDTFQNLRGSDHFIYKDGKTEGFFEKKDRESGAQPHARSDVDPRPPFIQSAREAEQEMAQYAESGDSGKTLKKRLGGKKFIFIISEYDGGFLISSVPCEYDNRALYYVLIIGGIFVVFGFIAAKIVANYISRPLRELEEFTKRVAVKNFSVPIEISNCDEIGTLADEMNKMQESLRRAEEEEKKFLQSISHDLKTPVMVIMSHADAIIDGVYVDSVENTALIIKNEAVSLSKKIKELLYLNTLDYVLENQTTNEKVNLGAICENTARRLEPVRRDISFFVTTGENLIITANTDKITVAVENILDNALRFASSRIEVSAMRGENGIEINISNDGEHIDERSINKIFDNMYKHKKGNFGLGLAITKKIVHFYGGTVVAQNTDSGVNFKIEFKYSKN